MTNFEKIHEIQGLLTEIRKESYGSSTSSTTALKKEPFQVTAGTVPNQFKEASYDKVTN